MSQKLYLKYAFLFFCIYKLSLNFGQKFYTGDTATLLKWESPKELQKNYVYYLSGFDRVGRPVWVCELGNWNVVKVVMEGGTKLDNFTKYVQQAMIRISGSPNLQLIPQHKHPRRLHKEFVLIIDFESKIFQRMFVHPPSFTYVVRMFELIRQVQNNPLKALFIINVDPVISSFMAYMQNLDSVLHLLHFYTNSSHYIPALGKYIEKDQLPEWYGGYKHFKPSAVYG